MPADRAQYDLHRAEPTGATGLRLLTVMKRPVYGFFVFGIVIITSFFEVCGRELQCQTVFVLLEVYRLSFDTDG